MVDRSHGDDTLVEDVDQARERAARLRWINAHIREASEADLIEDADVVDDEDGPPTVGEA
jgi:hypothetical protein